MQGAGFLDDFELFFRRGRIGAFSYLEVATTTPEIGSDCPLTVHTGGAGAELLIVGRGARRPVRDGAVIALRIEQDQPLTIVLFDAAGRQADALTLIPAVEVPALLALDLPATVSYALPALAAQLQASPGAEVQLSYRAGADDPLWRPLPLGADGRFALPLAARPQLLTLRIGLASRHAAFSARARCVIERQLQVGHPQPRAALARSGPFLRFQQAELALSVRWARACRLRYGARQAAMAAGPDGLLRCQLPLDSAEVGEQRIVLSIDSLDGATLEQVLTLEVQARPLTVALERRPGQLAIHLGGANRARLRIPARAVEAELPAEGAVLDYGFLLPARAELAVTDDHGAEHLHPLELEPLEPGWQALPTFSHAIGWRI